VAWTIALAVPMTAGAATLRVCASGCSYTNLQPAIDAARPGDTILLRAGQTFVGNFVLRAKDASSTAFITIRSDAADASLPAAGTRLVPQGRAGANTTPAVLARLVGASTAKTTPVLRTFPGAHHYRLQFIDFDGAAQLGYETLIAIGSDQADANPPHHIVFDRVYIHGHARKGQKRGVALNGGSTDVLNSYIADVKAINADSQAIEGWNGVGPYRIINNYLEASGENVMFGGAVPATKGLISSDIQISGNDIAKPTAWRNPILAPPASPHASASSASGSLAARTHYFKVVAVMASSSSEAVSLPSTEVSVTATAGHGVSLSWSASSGADKYRIYRGTSAGGEAVYVTTTGSATSFVYTGAGETSGRPPTFGTRWISKNLLELKSAQRVTIDGNVFENNWVEAQAGYAIVLTPRNSDGKVPWAAVRDVTFTNNIVRHTAGAFNILGYDTTVSAGSQLTERVTIRNNLFYDIDPSRWGGGQAKCFLLGQGATDVMFDRNTVAHNTTTVVAAYGKPMVRFKFTNNIALHGKYGVFGDSSSTGNPTLAKYFPGAVFTNNVLAGGKASLYPPTNSFPTVAQWNASFVDAASGNYQLLPSSVFYRAGSGGSIPGADIAQIESGSEAPAPPTGLRLK
jgi:hypothetical protein